MRNADFRRSKEDFWANAITALVPTDPNNARRDTATGTDGHTPVATGTAGSRPNSSNPYAAILSLACRFAKTTFSSLETTGDSTSEVIQHATRNSKNDLRMDIVSESGIDRNDILNIANENMERLGMGQTPAAADANAGDTSRPVVGFGSAGKEEKYKPDEEPVPRKLYKQFKDVNDKLQLLENAMSRLGGVGDVLSGIRQLRAALIITLWWDKNVFPSDFRWYDFRSDVKEGKLDSLEKVLARFKVNGWLDLKEDGEMFEANTYLPDVKMIVERVSTNWEQSTAASSVIASLISLSWLQSRIPMRTEEERFKRGVIFLLQNGPVILMTAAATTFMIGLALFVNSSNQSKKRLLSIDDLRKSAWAAPLQVWHTIARSVQFAKGRVGEDPTANDRTEEFLDESDSDAKQMSSSPSKIQVKLSTFDGPLVVTNSDTSSLTIYENSSPSRSNSIESLMGDVKQLLWSPDNE
ncbi:hypothetical protein EW145_g4282 [Phellinidium pouzarii]|uniref:Uncharacterized protein n=1 Tax=Phellinidium pouzarii TaxID=167371 RepID=A0A4V6S165_9AGAM|nr:hypothetical protein EW145_g4282 [Phellinidium pouzarii]